MSCTLSQTSEVLGRTSSLPGKKPESFWQRKYTPSKAGAVLAHVKDNTLILEQFGASAEHSLYRPVIFSPNYPATTQGKPKEILLADSKIAADTKAHKSCSGSRKSPRLNKPTSDTALNAHDPSGSKTPSNKIPAMPAIAPAIAKNTPKPESFLPKTPSKKPENRLASAAIGTPNGSKANTPVSTPKKNPLLTPSGVRKALPFILTTPEGSKMSSARNVEVEDDGVRKTLFFVSPERPKDAGNAVHRRSQKKSEAEQLVIEAIEASILADNRPFTSQRKRKHSGNTTPPPSATTSATTSASTTASATGAIDSGISAPHASSSLDKAIQKQSMESVKGDGQPITIALHKRNRKAHPAAKTVMHFTAKEALRAELHNKKGIWEESIIKVMESMLELELSMEHLHRLAFSLSPRNYNPQVPENLGVSGSWINTQMMVLEKVARFFAEKLKGLTGVVKITPTFKMMPKSTLIDEINYDVLLKSGTKELMFKHSIKALALPNRSNWPSSTDASQTIMVAEALLNKTAPAIRTTFAIH